MDVIFFIRGEKRSVEHVMDLPHFGEAELIHDWREDFDDSEESFLFESKLWICDRSFEVSGF